ncbi:phosphotyrosine protein phosphatases II [Gloeophyllum trabeum ATCC 11539]|uniref:Phosphotyrosine protein phosphatases II n=1 Tax=Gloeophyllum trabeum (strain ATCC 11539 / FP-39264 / Madison 617) TaxID=670483 RepID=S7RVS3_GLOTA|nr:phosphotyrosine protein phosphatases II [Gloeophyllum trabeum ATCC 11539]EPQ57374.1 phosphotyrosine protein phosphatases II [Gloeophyllum trabeum ATCC 11539]
MSSTLIETFETRPAFAEVAQWQASAEQGASLLLTPQVEVQVPSPEERLAAQIYHLASQHHTSEYNRAKFGPLGSPAPYVPLSIQYPDHFKELQTVQTHLLQLRTWWPSNKSLSSQQQATTIVEPHSPVPLITSKPDVVELQSELSAAIDEAPLAFAQRQQQLPQFPIKTSATHPINISMIIPPELMSVITSHLTRSRQPSPTIFDIPPACSLERLTLQPPPYYDVTPLPPFAIPPNPSRPRLSKPLPNAKEFATVFSSSTSFTKAMRAAMDCKIPGVGRKYSFADADAITVTVATVQSTYGLLTRSPSNKRSNSRGSAASVVPSKREITGDEKPEATCAIEDDLPDADAGFGTPTFPTPPQSKIGNLYLSSCPGKKVRLDGPVKGRGSVCRDLRSDLQRIKDLGVGCVICCLDDVELDFLGASWTEYSSIAQDIGLDVLRIPMPEGLAPLTPQLLDERLSQVIESYTLRGVPILAHCRGGVGRAGLVACCWVLKLGLCGWIETDPRPRVLLEAGEVRRDTMQLVERVIALIRRRRSIKAIETYEQVKFLVEFVEYLRERAPAPVGEVVVGLNEVAV